MFYSSFLQSLWSVDGVTLCFIPAIDHLAVSDVSDRLIYLSSMAEMLRLPSLFQNKQQSEQCEGQTLRTSVSISRLCVCISSNIMFWPPPSLPLWNTTVLSRRFGPATQEMYLLIARLRHLKSGVWILYCQILLLDNTCRFLGNCDNRVFGGGSEKKRGYSVPMLPKSTSCWLSFPPNCGYIMQHAVISSDAFIQLY